MQHKTMSFKQHMKPGRLPKNLLLSDSPFSFPGLDSAAPQSLLPSTWTLRTPSFSGSLPL